MKKSFLGSLQGIGDVQSNIFLDQSYKDITNACESRFTDVCDNNQFWWEKMEYEIKKYNAEFYTLYEFLVEALEVKHYKYFPAAIENYRGDDSLIYNLFFKYGFATDNIEIMKKYAKTNHHGLFKAYQNINNENYKGSKIVNIINEGYFTYDEYYQVLSSALENNDIDVVELLYYTEDYNHPFQLPVRDHPRREIFNKLILRFIGVSRDIETSNIDLKKFARLVQLYVGVISSRRYLFNLIFDTYEIKTLDKRIYNIIYNPPINKYEREVLDLFITDKLLDANLVSKLLLQIPIYKNSKIIDYIITGEINFIKKNTHTFSAIDLYFHQFRKFLQLVDEETYNNFIKNFLWGGFIKQTMLIPKIQLLLDHKYFKDEVIARIAWRWRSGSVVDESLISFFKDFRVQEYMNTHGYFIESTVNGDRMKYVILRIK